MIHDLAPQQTANTRVMIHDLAPQQTANTRVVVSPDGNWIAIVATPATK